ncbi:MAG TPA: chromosome segregation protein SMC [Anaerolineales bacterium]
MSPQPRKSSRLKSLELQGYKTFASKTEFSFAPTITAVVGPNGSGKSNIADAIRWVLGEQSYSLLRGKKTEDMIFTGSESRPRASMASAIIEFDNSEEWLPIDFSQVTVGRRAYRDGQNEYLINDQRVRLRDVGELLAESGLAQRTYTIIGQGLVDAALALRAEERRQLFEEAAGIGLYRSRRDEAIRRLVATRRNLERVQDILAELRPRLRSLERQAQRAKDYEQVKEDLQSALRIWYGFHWSQMQGAVAVSRRAASEQADSRGRLRAQQSKSDQQLAEVRQRIGELRQQLSGWSGEVSELYRQREALGRQVAVLQERIGWLEEQAEELASGLEALEIEQDRAAKAAEVARAELAAQHGQVEELEAAAGGGSPALRDRSQLEQTAEVHRRQLEALAARRAAWETRQASWDTQLDEGQTRWDQTQAARQQTQTEADTAAGRLAEAKAAYGRAEAQLEAARQTLAALEAEARSLAADLETAAERQAKVDMALARSQAQLQASRGARSGQAGLEQLVEAARRGELPTDLGRLMDGLQIPADFRQAVSTALGELLSAVVVQSQQGLRQALAYLERQGSPGRTVLLALEQSGDQPTPAPPKGEGVLASVADVLGAKGHVEAAVRRILGSTWIVKDRQTALRLLPELALGGRLVTQQGELFSADGTVVVGAADESSGLEEETKLEASIAGLESEQADVRAARQGLVDHQEGLRQRRRQAETALREARQQQEAAATELRQVQLEADRRQQQLELLELQEKELAADRSRLSESRRQHLSEAEAFDEEHARLERALREIQRQLAGSGVVDSGLEVRWQTAKKAEETVRARLAERQGRLAAITADVTQWRRRQDENLAALETKRAELSRAESEAKKIEAALQEHREQVEPAEEELRLAEKQRSDLEVGENQLRYEAQRVENQHSQAQVELARREEELHGLQRRIEDDFGLVAYEYDEETTGQDPLPLEGLVEKLPAVASLPEGLEAQVKRLRAQLRRMGSINPEARQEYHHVRERVEFMTTQVDDLRRAESQIQEVIAELDVIMAREFRKTFDAVAVAFRETFQQLFGGGSARLELSNPDDPNESGIEIEARLPGKREQGLAVLSGGERSLTASALVFALLKVSPTPFCVLDEVDAMLDEANVGRFCELLRELSEQTQFIVITHNRQTVEVAEAVYGVTMNADSTSQIISLDLEEAASQVAA